MASQRELRKYQDPEEARRRASRNFTLGWMLALAVLMMAAAGSTLTAKPGSGEDVVANIAQRAHQLAVERNDQRQQFAGLVRLADNGQR